MAPGDTATPQDRIGFALRELAATRDFPASYGEGPVLTVWPDSSWDLIQKDTETKSLWWPCWYFLDSYGPGPVSARAPDAGA